MSALNDNIRCFRELRKLTQKRFAEKLNKSRNVISNWERGENSPDPDTIEQICKVLNVTPNMIFGWEPCPDYERYIKRLDEYRQRVEELVEKRAKIEMELAEAKMILENELSEAKDS